MQIMKRSNHRAPGQAYPMVMAMLAGLCWALPAHAQLGLPPVVAPVVPAVQQPLQQLPSTLRNTTNLPGVSTVLPTTVTQPVLQVPPTVQTSQPPVVQPAAPTLPTLTTPTSTPALAVETAPVPPVSEGVRGLVPLQQLRASTVRDLLRLRGDVLEADPFGEPVRRQELLWVSPSPQVLRSALALGFAVLREHNLPELDLRELVLRPPAGMATAQALEQLRALAPDVEADFNHVYTRSGGAAGGGSDERPAATALRRVGLVDGGVDHQHAALRGATVHVWGCGGAAHPSSHGTAVASLLVGRETAFAGSAAGTTLFAADIYCGQPADGAAETIALALAWMARENVAVINISLVGPANRLLERAVQALVRKGFLLVAAVGNDGPAAPPLYPAAYAGVVGVTAVSPQRKSLPEAAQGPHVMFAALGAGVAVAEPGGGYTLARGTSFAAPRVAALLAQSHGAPGPQAAAAALARLAASAVDLGVAGRDPVFGYGLVGAQR
jgi:hypothetical protein